MNKTITRKYRRTKLGFTLSVMLLMITAFAQNAFAQGQVVVNTNGSFENSDITVSGDTASVEGWQFFVLDDGAAGTYAIVDSVTKDGNRALAISATSTGPEDYSLGAVNEGIPVTPGVNYTVTLWAKASEAGATANFTVHNPNNNYTELGRVGNANVSLTTEWQEYSFTFTGPAGTDTVRAPMHFSFEANVGKTVYLDSVRVTHPKILGEPLIVEAESGDVGSEWATETDEGDGSTYVTITSDTEATSGTANSPGENRTISYELTFPDTGSYDLFARVYVGSATFDDDSWFIPVGFGEKHPDSTSHWQVSNGLASAGFNMPSDVVRNAGGVGEGTWKWVNLSKNGYQGAPADTFMVNDPDSLTRIFEVGARENGFRIDKIAFGLSSYYYTVENLNNGEAGSAEPPVPPVEPQDPIAQGKAKWLGNIYSSNQIENFTSYWNQVTAENAGKWGSVEGTRDEMNWGPLDEAYNLAKDNGFPYRFHILIWGGQQPGWINDLSTEEQLEEIEEWMDLVAERYPDMEYVEVVNEGSNGHQLPDGQSGDANYIEALGGTGDTGHDWIITAFEMARERFPNAKLMINDYNIVSSNTWGTPNARNYKNIIDDLVERDLIDVIGVQAHAFSTVGSQSQIRAVLDLLAETGLPIQATEMDIDGDPNAVTTATSDAEQLGNIQRIFPVFWEHPAVEGVTMWGWRPGLWRQDQDAFLVRSSGEERPALEWLRAYVDTASVEFSVSNEELITNTPEQFELSHNYPNPFNPTTQISYNLPRNAEVSLRVYDITGRLIQTLVNTRQSAGSHTVSFNASNLSSGVYFYRMEAGTFTDVKQMMLIK
tara:strand:- start:44672 stop:47155 length:2484 start_codon:yes stop_codon:yes gene_type:complete